MIRLHSSLPYNGEVRRESNGPGKEATEPPVKQGDTMKKPNPTLIITIIAALLLFPIAEMFAIDFTFAGVRTYTVFGFLPAPTGADAKFGISGDGVIGGLPASISLAIGGGYEVEEVYRTGDGANLTTVTDISRISIDRFEAYVEPAFTQQLSAAPLDLYFGARVYFRENLPSPNAIHSSGSYFPDEIRLLETSIRPGIRYKTLKNDRHHGDMRGIDTGTMIEWAPSFLGNRIVGAADYARLNAAVRYYAPLFDIAPDRKLNVFNAYFAGQVVVDWLTGTSIPFHEQAKFGGFYPKQGMGGNIRGFENFEHPALFKSALNLEARFVGPAFFVETIFPVLVTFVDVGYFSGFKADGYFKPANDSDIESSNGVLASAGATISLNLMGITYIGFTFAIPLAGTRADDSGIDTALAIGLHF